MLHKTINKVYVVTADTATSAYASCIEIFGIFSDELKAMGASAKIKKELGHYAKIHEVPIDELFEGENTFYCGGFDD